MPAFTDVNTLKNVYLNKFRVDDDTYLAPLLDSAETLFQKITHRRFTPDPALVSGSDTAAPTVRRLDSGGRILDLAERHRYIPVPDLRVVTSVAIVGTAVPQASAPGVYPLDGWELVQDAQLGTPATGILIPLRYIPFVTTGLISGQLYDGVGDVVITGRWGFLTAPGDVKDAVYLIAAKAWAEREARFADYINLEAGDVASYMRTMPARAYSTAMAYRTPPAGM